MMQDAGTGVYSSSVISMCLIAVWFVELDAPHKRRDGIDLPFSSDPTRTLVLRPDGPSLPGQDV